MPKAGLRLPFVCMRVGKTQCRAGKLADKSVPCASRFPLRNEPGQDIRGWRRTGEHVLLLQHVRPPPVMGRGREVSG